MILKAAGSGGGRGMHVVKETAALAEALSVTREEARRAFGNPRCYATATPSGSAAATAALQRRHQKVLGEAPAPGLAPELVAEVGACCAEACRQIGYEGAGTLSSCSRPGSSPSSR